MFQRFCSRTIQKLSNSRSRRRFSLSVIAGLAWAAIPTGTPGNSPGVVSFGGDLIMGASTFTQFELGGLSTGLFDQLLVSGNLFLNGTLDIQLIDGSQPCRSLRPCCSLRRQEWVRSGSAAECDPIQRTAKAI